MKKRGLPSRARGGHVILDTHDFDKWGSLEPGFYVDGETPSSGEISVIKDDEWTTIVYRLGVGRYEIRLRRKFAKRLAREI